MATFMVHGSCIVSEVADMTGMQETFCHRLFVACCETVVRCVGVGEMELFDMGH